MSKNTQQINFIVDNIVLLLIGLFSLGYSLFTRRFAELHFNLPFLNFPIFIGEVLLFLCLILFCIRWRNSLPKLNPWYYLLFLYLAFVLIKAFYGYFKWGPLAFRHAALFYYPLFAVFGYTFFNRDFFDNKKILLLVFLFITGLSPSLVPYTGYFFLTCLLLAIVLIKAYPRRDIKTILFLLLIIISPYKLFFETSRAGLVSNITAAVSIMVALFIILKIKKIYKVLIFAIVIMAILIGVLKTADSTGAKTLLNIKGSLNLYNKNNQIIALKKDSFKMKEFVDVRLYKPEAEQLAESKRIEQITPAIKEKLQNEIEGMRSQIEEQRLKLSQSQAKEITQLKIKEREEELKERQSKLDEMEFGKRDLLSATSNILFRIFIWKDMMSQLKEVKSIFGIDFGKPFRSKNIEILKFGEGDWRRDYGGTGWVTAHNSYLEIIYRSGIVGILLICFVFAVLFRMIKRSVVIKSLNGILLCGILIYWLMLSNFLVILELPYNAIPFWSLFGMVFAYLKIL